ncbi:hypothetical protein [Phenylobacterium sp.]|jgi:hypothetical protein|uniref:hypothetical protein n=1 Tax=Phenylobacterium sp. TaxID=1871053 RepID=UPI002F945327
MNLEQTRRWLAAGRRLGLEVIAPCQLILSNGSKLEATALVKVGPPKGMVVDPAWSVLEPHAHQLVAEGFGYSAVTIGEDDDLSDLLRDWAPG